MSRLRGAVLRGPRNARPVAGGRSYVWDGPAGRETFASVTTIINKVIAKPALPGWAARSVAEHVADNWRQCAALGRELGRDGLVEVLRQVPWTQRDRAADRGSLVHSLAEAATLGQEPDVPPGVEGYVAAWRRWREEHQPTFIAAEATVYARQAPGWAGTLDAIAEIPGLGRVLVDYKTGKDLYPEVSLQLTAYAMADFVAVGTTEVPMPQAERLFALLLSGDGTYDFCEVARCDGGWRAVLELWAWSQRRDLIGPSISAPGGLL